MAQKLRKHGKKLEKTSVGCHIDFTILLSMLKVKIGKDGPILFHAKSSNLHCLPSSEGRDVFPCDFRAKIYFFALNDCLCVIIMENDGVQFFRLFEPILWALFLGHAHFCVITTLLTLVVLFLLLKLAFYLVLCI